jgi:UDP-galactopyranose mutase
MIEGIDVKLNTDFFLEKDYWMQQADKIVYTGKIDEFFEFQFGELDYRSLRFEHEVLDTDNYQGNAVVNYTSAEIPFTRILEHKHFDFGNQPKTIITKEYPQDGKNNEPYYPINDESNNEKYQKYKALSQEHPHIVFGGRLAEYKYYDMHQVIESALNQVKTISDGD